MTTTLYLIRHAEARGNVDRIFHGHFDSELTDKGNVQLKLLGDKFKSINYDAIYSSDLKRAINTAKAVNHKNLEIHTTNKLREIFGGKWENMYFKDIPLMYPKEFDIWDKSMQLLEMPDGESFKEFSDRISSEIDSIAKDNKGKTVIIATHGTAVKAYLCYVKYSDYAKISEIDWADNTAVTKIEIDDEFKKKIIFESDSSHLSSDMSTITHQKWFKEKNNINNVVTVTLNTCIDRNIFINDFVLGGLNRVNKTTLNYAGKGIAVSNALSNLNVNSFATGFLAKNNFAEFNNCLLKYDIKNEFVLVDGNARENIKILDLNSGEQTEFNESGIFIDEKNKEMLFDKIANLCDNSKFIVISGSNPPNFTFDDYKNLVDIILKSNAKLIIDSEGERLNFAIESKAFLIKPNLFELETLLDKKLDTLEKIKSAVQGILNKGVQNVVVTMGSYGAVFANFTSCYYVKAITLKPVGLAGAGDSALAGFLAGYIKDKTFKECAILSVATASASVITKGTNPPLLADIERFINEVDIKLI